MIGKVIYNLLANSSEVTALVSTKIYPNIILDEKAVNYIVYQTNSTTPTDCKDGRSTLDVLSVDILVFASTLDLCNQISLAVRNTLDRYSGVNSGLTIDKIIFTGDNNDFDEESQIYFKSIQYDVRFKNIYSTLARPTNFAAGYTGSTSINLTWTDNATGETGYKVYRSTDGITFSSIASIAANSSSYSDSSVSADSIYYYYVVAYGSDGNGYASAVIAQRTNGS